jgi:hypothetical protein
MHNKILFDLNRSSKSTTRDKNMGFAPAQITGFLSNVLFGLNHGHYMSASDIYIMPLMASHCISLTGQHSISLTGLSA